MLAYDMNGLAKDCVKCISHNLSLEIKGVLSDDRLLGGVLFDA
jgi:hypothetical protein